MKKLLVLSVIALITFASCEDRDLYIGENYVIDEKFMMQEAYAVPLQSGQVAVVTLGEDTLAITDMSLTFNIPLGAGPITRAEGNGKVQVTYASYKDLPTFETGSYIVTSNHTLLFEDSRTADYDYNDLVLHVQTSENGKVDGAQAFKIRVRGLALGSGKQIGFGVTDRNGVDFDLTDNVRRDYFSNKQGFLNTERGGAFVVGIEASDKDDENRGSFVIRHRPVNGKEMQTGYVEYPLIEATYKGAGNERKDLKFYIKVDNGDKLYVGEYNKNMDGALPYGIRTDEGQNFYPLERTQIALAFPEFMSWVKTGSPIDWNSKPNTNASNCYTLNSGGLWRW